jgi:hypothetical protein
MIGRQQLTVLRRKLIHTEHFEFSLGDDGGEGAGRHFTAVRPFGVQITAFQVDMSSVRLTNLFDWKRRAIHFQFNRRFAHRTIVKPFNLTTMVCAV